MISDVPGPVLLRRFFESDYEPLRLRGRSDNTRRLYRTTFNNFERYLQRAPLVADLTDDTVTRFLDWFRRLGKGRSPCSVNKERNNLLAIWRFACRRVGPDKSPLRSEWPNVEPDIEPQDDPVAWLRHELAALFLAISKLAGRVGRIDASLWWLAVHSVIWDSGERISATLKLTWSDVDLKNGWVRFRAATRKGGRKGRTHKLHIDTIVVLRALRFAGRCGPDDLVFVWPHSATHLWYHYTKILAAAGLPTDRKSKFHRMRRSVASWAAAAGLNAMELLGHSGPKITAKYIDPRIAQKTQASDVLFRPGKNEGELLDRSGM